MVSKNFSAAIDAVPTSVWMKGLGNCKGFVKVPGLCSMVLQLVRLTKDRESDSVSQEKVSPCLECY
jgi:hypothetical protein